MKIGELAGATGVSCDTLRFYEKRGLIRAGRGGNGYRQYAPETAQLVGYIRMAQKLGFSLAEIGENLPALWEADKPDQAVARLLEEKVVAIDLRIAELQALKTGLLERLRLVCPLAAD
ncbi:MerR family transcriptional regulator [Massilia sp. AB1]|uniref:MerR family transcriptional regulator n=1 Tax=Massilia sp. AB1 TaxID=2823371 RepID=UPI001B843B76|nr:MerR family transcriptional regulator [Massilia sp. AB1]MBQ5940356.1 MerR family transcriptional regulator [Massilia sp. AB1]